MQNKRTFFESASESKSKRKVHLSMNEKLVPRLVMNIPKSFLRSFGWLTSSYLGMSSSFSILTRSMSTL